MTALETTIYGEPLSDLLPALIEIHANFVHQDDGSISFDGTLPWDRALPLARAMLRAEAEIMIEDAEEMVAPPTSERTPEQRCHDAFMRIVGGLR